MPEPTIVVLTGYTDIFQQFYAATETYEPEAKKIVVVWGAEARIHIPERTVGKWTVIHKHVEPFTYAACANRGIMQAEKSDVLLCNDDIEFLRPGDLAEMSHAAQWADIVSPLISGIVGNDLQRYQQTPLATAYSHRPLRVIGRLCFPCVYIRRAVFDKIGYLDEAFTGYGRDDDDFCRRAQAAGFQLAITPDVVVKHGFQGQGCSSSFLRVLGKEKYLEATKEGDRIFQEKWAK